MDIKTNWEKFVAASSDGTDITYADANGNYYLFRAASGVQLVCVLSKDSADATDFENNYKSGATALL